MIRIKQSLKQTWEDARRNPVYTAIYVTGVALAVTFTMIFAMVYYVKIAPVYPEYNRLSTSYITYAEGYCESQHMTCGSGLGYRAYKEYLSRLKNVKYMTATLEDRFSESATILPDDGRPEIKTVSKGVDADFFKVYEFEFLKGKPFTAIDVDDARLVAVISDRLADRLFGSPEAAMGREVNLENTYYRVAGVVREGSNLTDKSFAQIYVPLTTRPDYDRTSCDYEWLGGIKLAIVTEDKEQERALHAEIADMLRRVNSMDTTWTVKIDNQPVTHIESVFRTYNNIDFSWIDILKEYGIILFALLLIPAMNLSGMIAGRMETRLPEMGIRKSFGATRRTLMHQVLLENFYMTFAGGILGLIASWLVIFVNRNWIFSLLSKSSYITLSPVDTHVTGEMLFAPLVFVITLLLCMGLNLLSAYIPVRWALRHPIVSSLNEKR